MDYRALNRITVKTRYPLPLINDYIDRLGNARCFSALDMVSGFPQLRVAEESIHKTAFVTPEGHYEYCKMPYGLANAPIVYQKTITKTLKSFIDAGQVLVYIDDVLLLTDGIDENLVLLEAVVKTLTEAGFSINIKKCTFLTNEIEYLGRIIGGGQVRPSTYKIDALVKSPRPSSVKQVRQFLGLAGYFRRYIPDYAIKTAHIAALTKKSVNFNWCDEHETWHFWFPGLRQFVSKYVTHCVVCISHKQVPRAPFQPISSWKKVPVPFDTIHVDVLGPLKESDCHKHVLIIVDAYTKYCLLHAIPRL